MYKWNDKLLTAVCALVFDRQWITLDIVFRNDVLGNKGPTILIGAREADELCWWDNILPAVNQLLQAIQSTSDIQVRLRYRQ
jgi:hypothetical protein